MHIQNAPLRTMSGFRHLQSTRGGAWINLRGCPAEDVQTVATPTSRPIGDIEDRCTLCAPLSPADRICIEDFPMPKLKKAARREAEAVFVGG